MRFWSAWMQAVWPAKSCWVGIDMGNGQTLLPEDVLEGHYMRLAARQRAVLPGVEVGSGPQSVQIQVADSTIAAIQVLAPRLAPLTELAEDVAEALPPVRPAPHFRQTLHEALEQTHRQQSAQRLLGTRPVPQTGTPAWLLWVAATTIVVIALVLWRLLWPQSRSERIAT
jgi:hypothetical protein